MFRWSLLRDLKERGNISNIKIYRRLKIEVKELHSKWCKYVQRDANRQMKEI